MRRRLVAPGALFAGALLLGVSACGESSPTSPVADDLLVRADLRPQPEPPGHQTFSFILTADGLPGGGTVWTGAVLDGTTECAHFSLTDFSAEATGMVTHVSGLATITGIVNPDYSLEAEISGLYNHRNGLLVASGPITGGDIEGGTFHQQGFATLDSGSTFGSWFGEISLRPQPEPPGRSLGVRYPPNPCAS